VSSSTPTVDVNAIMTRSQARVWKTLEGEPGFIISVADTQNILGEAARSKMNFVILNVDLVASTKLSMTLPLDRLTMMIQAFNQEMSLIVKEFGGFILKYVGDAVLAFFLVPSHQSQPKVACTPCNKLCKMHASGGPRRDKSDSKSIRLFCNECKDRNRHW
jgi:class 3 adenylate cyclase